MQQQLIAAGETITDACNMMFNLQIGANETDQKLDITIVDMQACIRSR